MKFEKLDAAESVFFQRELENIRAKTYNVKYAALKGLSLVPVDTSVDPGEELVTYRQYDLVGSAKLIASYSTDFPRADVKAKEFTSRIRSLGASYGYNLQEIRAARRAQKPLDQMKANSARRAVDLSMDKAVRTGLSELGSNLLGLLNQPNATVYTVATGAGSSKTFRLKTPDEILADLHGVVQNQINITLEVEPPDSMGLPSDQFGYISTTRYSSLDPNTILKVFLANNPYIQTVFSWLPLKGAGAAATDRGIIYRRDPDALQFIMPVAFEQFPPQEEGMEFVTYCHARTGGVVMYYPLSMSYFDGI